MKILQNSSIVGLWQDVVHEAEFACDASLQQDIEAYLVYLLIRFTSRPEIAKQIMASQLLESLNLTAQKREIAFQYVGDSCLLFSGLFPGLAEKRLVKVSYFIHVGQSAYSNISKTSTDLYASLARQFVLLMDVLQSLRGYSKSHPDLLPLQAYELWNEVGSQRALRALKQYSSALPLQSQEAERDICLIKFKR